MTTIVWMEVRLPALLDVVALLADRPELGLFRGAVGTVVEPLDDETSLVEFSDDHGRATAIAACPHLGLRRVASPQN
jgi:hypothetical protein